MSRCPIRRRQALRRDAFEIADSGRLAFLRPWLTAWYRMCGSARDGAAVAVYAQGLSGRGGVSLAGAGELAAEPAVLVQAAAGTSIRPVCVTPPILTGSDPQTVMSRPIAAAARSSSVA